MKRFIGWHIFLIFIFWPFIHGMAAENHTWEEVFFKANQAYKEGRFQDAAEGYLRLIEGGHENGHLDYNLGNAYFRLNDLGRAILFYERARRFIPRDADLNFNLRYARDQVRDIIPQSKDFITMTFFWLDNLNLGELFWSFVFLTFLFFAVLFIRLFYRGEWTYYFFVATLILTIIAGASFGLKWYRVKTDDRAVIISDEINVLAGPDPQDTILFNLHKGAIVHQERTEDGWSLVHLSEEKRGWIRSQEIERIRRNDLKKNISKV